MLIHVGGCAGGKAKPLKAPKAEKKEYDEVSSFFFSNTKFQFVYTA